jgi:hypothetical protein
VAKLVSFLHENSIERKKETSTYHKEQTERDISRENEEGK